MTYFKTTLLASGALLSAAVADAQIGIGIQGGFINSNATIESVVSGSAIERNTESITAWTVGIPVEISLSKFFALQPEFNLLRRGYDFGDSTADGAGIEYTVVSIPVLGKIGFVGDAFTIAATFGPAFQYIASGKADLGLGNGQLESIDINFDEFPYDNYSRTAIYGIIGAQAGLPVGFGKLIADARYRFQLDDEDGRDDVEVRGRGFSVTAGIIFTLGSY